MWPQAGYPKPRLSETNARNGTMTTMQSPLHGTKQRLHDRACPGPIFARNETTGPAASRPRSLAGSSSLVRAEILHALLRLPLSWIPLSWVPRAHVSLSWLPLCALLLAIPTQWTNQPRPLSGPQALAALPPGGSRSGKAKLRPGLSGDRHSASRGRQVTSMVRPNVSSSRPSTSSSRPSAPGSRPGASRSHHSAPIPLGLRKLQAAYPHAVCRLQPNALILCDQTRIPYDDGRTKSAQDKLSHPDLEDQMSLAYPSGPHFSHPPRHDPGRIRFLPLFKKLYGASERRVRAQLVSVRWTPSRGSRTFIRFNKAQGAALALQKAADELARLPRPLRRSVIRRPSTFLWRFIKGTRRLSAHSFGIALDLSLRHPAYWRWDLFGPAHRMRYRNNLPMAVVCIFEKHGFIWGGKWRHYDTMHFEYRPELLVAKDPAHPGRWTITDPCPHAPSGSLRHP